jgi:hypothetical protein
MDNLGRWLALTSMLQLSKEYAALSKAPPPFIIARRAWHYR